MIGVLPEMKRSLSLKSLDFQLPAHLEAGEPPEARGLDRDQVRLMVSHYRNDQIRHAEFREIGRFLQSGDLLVVNNSGTMNAALPAVRDDGQALELHLSTRLPADVWSVELRRPSTKATDPFYKARAGERLSLPDGGMVTLLTPYNPCQRQQLEGKVRLWLATLRLPVPLDDYLAQHGYPIRYKYVHEQWPLRYYQTVFATEMGSAEMPSAGRAFSPQIVTQLVSWGVQIAPITLHTGVASLEDHEPPYEEFYRVPTATARLINSTRAAGGRIIAVGTTVVRALETAVDSASGHVHPGEGWTSLIITPQRGIKAVDGLLTGFHEPQATHLAMLAAFTGEKHLELTYQQALQQGYLWHEFGDLHLLLP
jgi:S-adenosylmethionine:tRNA ribosyltransferase-isomerase